MYGSTNVMNVQQYKNLQDTKGTVEDMTVGAIMDRLSLDFVGTFIETSRENKYILAVVEKFREKTSTS